ncbi:MAG: family 43 glycosylhydrolase [Actinomycetota bacterium]|nr:family 43 glycosylhydrolase [Actinomycetota bacterium]
MLGSVLVIVAVTAACTPGLAPAPGLPFRDSSNGVHGTRGWFEGGQLWYGEFGDPHVIRDGSTYYAYASPVAGRYLPVLTSTDLVTWRIHRGWSTNGPPGRSGYSVAADASIPAEIRAQPMSEWDRYDLNDGQARAPQWGLDDGGTWLRRAAWAPGVTKIGSTWFSYSAIRVSFASDDPHGFGRFCLTAASSASPIGPFRDTSGAAPIQCQPASTDPAGSIDPFPFVDDGAANQPYLLWKAAGKVGSRPSSLLSVPLGSNGKPIPGRAPIKLLDTNEGGWEGSTIENPAMIRYGNRYYLFYSGNYSGVLDASGRSQYATGYAICPQGPRAPCQRQTVGSPLLASTPTEQGPGGASPVIDTNGALRLAYAFYWPGENRTELTAEHSRHPRRMNVATLVVRSDGTLTAVRRAWKPQA